MTTSLLEQLEALSQPAPVLSATGDDDDPDDVTRARVGDFEEDFDDAAAAGPSALRARNTKSLADVDERYSGQPVARSSLFSAEFDMPESTSSEVRAAKRKRGAQSDSDEEYFGGSDAEANGGASDELESDDEAEDEEDGDDGQEDLRGWRDRNQKKSGGDAKQKADAKMQVFSKQPVNTDPDTADPVQMTREWLQLQRQRKEQVKKAQVDTRASKGRKVRYEVHKKMLNYMAPVDNCPMNDAAVDELYQSLFSRN